MKMQGRLLTACTSFSSFFATVINFWKLFEATSRGSFQGDRIPSVTHRWLCSTADESNCCSQETLLHDATFEFKRRDAVNYALNSGVGKQQVSKMVITRIVSMKSSFFVTTHMNEITQCALTCWPWAKRSSITKNAMLMTVGCDRLSQHSKTSCRNDEKMYSVTNRRYFRRHECPCKCSRAWGPSSPYCHLKGDCQVSRSLVRTGLLRSTGGCQSELSRVCFKLFQSAYDCQSGCSRVWSKVFPIGWCLPIRTFARLVWVVPSADCQLVRSRVSSALHFCQMNTSIWWSLFSSLFFGIFCFLASSILSSLTFNFAGDLARSFLKCIPRMVTRVGKCQDRSVGRSQKISVLECSSHGIVDFLWVWKPFLAVSFTKTSIPLEWELSSPRLFSLPCIRTRELLQNSLMILGPSGFSPWENSHEATNQDHLLS